MKQKLANALWSFKDVLVHDFDGRAQSRRNILSFNYIDSMIANLVSSTYFVGLMLHMGADEQYISLVTLVTTICGCAQLFAPLLFERMQRRKKLLITSRCCYHLLNVLLIGIIPLFPVSKPVMLSLFLGTVLLMNLINSLSSPALSIWHMQSIPESKHSNFFTFFNIGTGLVGTLSGLAAGVVVDHFQADSVSLLGIPPALSAFLLLRVVALAAAVVEFFCMLRIKESPYPIDPELQGRQSLKLLVLPLKNRLFLKTISIYLINCFVAGIIGNYFNVYLLDIVGVSYTYLSLASTLSLPLLLLMTPIWTRLVNRFSWNKMLPAVLGGMALAYFFNAVITAETQYYYLVVMLVYYAFAPSVNIIFSYLPYVNMPQQNQTAYISFHSMCGMLASFLGTSFGALFMSLTEGCTLPFFGMEMLNYQYVNLLQFALFILLAVYTGCIGKSLNKTNRN